MSATREHEVDLDLRAEAPDLHRTRIGGPVQARHLRRGGASAFGQLRRGNELGHLVGIRQPPERSVELEGAAGDERAGRCDGGLPGAQLVGRGEQAGLGVGQAHHGGRGDPEQEDRDDKRLAAIVLFHGVHSMRRTADARSGMPPRPTNPSAT